MAEQIAHVADHIDGERALAEGQGRRLVVVSHSIGGYFALKAQRDAPVICVTPYLENREDDPAFRKLRRLVTSPLAPVLASALASVATVLGVVPRVVRRRILRAAGATVEELENVPTCLADSRHGMACEKGEIDFAPAAKASGDGKRYSGRPG